MPVWNGAGFLARAVASVRAQTLPEWELIVVDDGSSDATPVQLAALARQDPRVRMVATPHQGIVAALNTGLAQARSPLIVRMDVDDEAHPERLAAQVEFLAHNPDLGVAGCLVEYGGDRRAQAGYARHVDWLNTLVSAEDIARNRFVESPLAHPSVMFRRALVAAHGGYREGPFPEDYELWLRWLEAGVRIGKVPRVLLTWNDPPQRLSRVDPRYAPAAFYECKAAYLARWLQRHVPVSRPLLVWGAGRLTRRRVERLTAPGVRVAGYVDIDPRKIGKRFNGCPVIGPADLPSPTEAFVLGYVGKLGARDLIRSRLKERGCVEGRDFLMAA